MAISDFLENATLNHLYRGAASPQQDTYWIALFTDATGDDGTGTEVSISDWTNYARVAVDASAASSIFTAATTGSTDNGSVIDFGTATIANPVTLVSIAIMDQATGGNMREHGALATSKPVSDGDPVTFPIGDLDITRD